MGIACSQVSTETRKRNFLLVARFALPTQILIQANGVTTDRLNVNQSMTQEFFEAEFQTLFNKLDEKKKRSIDVIHVGEALKSLGYSVEDLPLKQLLQNAGVESGDQINFDFFVKVLLGYIRRSDPEVEMKKAFEVFDHDKDGLIAADEIRTTMKWNDKAIAKFVRKADRNNDGMIDYNEFIRLLLDNDDSDDIDFN